MIQLISFSEMNGTYAYKIQLINASNTMDWELFFCRTWRTKTAQ